MDYAQTLEWLFSQLPMYQKEGASAYKADIGNIVSASQQLGNPHLKFKSIHIAGTNGKGSCSHMLASILQEAGYKTGLYTSPHLKDFRERVRINGEMISKNKVIEFVNKNKDFFVGLDASFFEMTVALAFQHFADEKVDIAIIETGLGGRLDSTNLIKPELSIITNISLDHTNLLGNTLEKIAIEKAGIIKENTPVIIGKKQEQLIPLFKNIAKQKNAEISWATNSNYRSDLKGDCQSENTNTVVSAVKKLQASGWKVKESNLAEGLQNVVANTGLEGRWQTLSLQPKVICDTAHNYEGVSLVMTQLKKEKYNKLHVVVGVANDKEVNGILGLFPQEATYYFCKANIPRALNEHKLQESANQLKLKGNAYTTVDQAVKQAKAAALEDDLIFIGGSTFVVAEVV